MIINFGISLALLFSLTHSAMMSFAPCVYPIQAVEYAFSESEPCGDADTENGIPCVVWRPFILQDIEENLRSQPDMLANGLAITTANIKEGYPLTV